MFLVSRAGRVRRIPVKVIIHLTGRVSDCLLSSLASPHPHYSDQWSVITHVSEHCSLSVADRSAGASSAVLCEHSSEYRQVNKMFGDRVRTRYVPWDRCNPDAALARCEPSGAAFMQHKSKRSEFELTSLCYCTYESYIFSSDSKLLIWATSLFSLKSRKVRLVKVLLGSTALCLKRVGRSLRPNVTDLRCDELQASCDFFVVPVCTHHKVDREFNFKDNTLGMFDFVRDELTTISHRLRMQHSPSQKRWLTFRYLHHSWIPDNDLVFMFCF